MNYLVKPPSERSSTYTTTIIEKNRTVPIKSKNPLESVKGDKNEGGKIKGKIKGSKGIGKK